MFLSSRRGRTLLLSDESAGAVHGKVSAYESTVCCSLPARLDVQGRILECEAMISDSATSREQKLVEYVRFAISCVERLEDTRAFNCKQTY